MSLFGRSKDKPIAVTGIRGPAKEFPDGSGLRVSIDVDPHLVRDFHQSFPEVGMPVALGRLVDQGQDAPPAVLGVRRPVREQVDGTLRVFIDIPQDYRNQFFESFQHVGEPVALTAMAVGARQVKQGKLVKLAGEVCRNYGFRVYVGHLLEGGFQPVSEEIAAQWLRDECGIASRTALDANPEAAERFRLVQARFIEWARENNLEAVCR